MDCSMPGSLVLHCLLEFAQVHVHWVRMLSNHLILCCPFCLQSFPASRSFQMSWLFLPSGQSIGASASASVLPRIIKGWLPKGLTGLVFAYQDHIDPLAPLNFPILKYSITGCIKYSPPASRFDLGGISWSPRAVWELTALPAQSWYEPGSVQFSHSVVSDSLLPHGPQHARPPCPSLTPGVYANSSPLSQWT